MTHATMPRLLSVIAPCRNEAAFIDAFCDSVLRQQLPDLGPDEAVERVHGRLFVLWRAGQNRSE